MLKSSRKIIVRVCEVANVKKQFKMFQMYSHMQRRNAGSEEKKEQETTGHDRFYQERSRYELSVFGEWRNFFVNDAVQLEAKTNKKLIKMLISFLHAVKKRIISLSNI